ncbi:hypothetical protein TVAG_116900 [Trichomonas vaginalis G3]|uniref:Uncharacterized protein n=1 Tax=Trichomonas vaginalis (strain ATCC PRA-98 / G3) TaxID=412133 RepID=A2FD65_TRIV3|nr:hypothetical protein TVAGG3_1005170 [Trichomonas vaginalis G3]EAX97172.1 hypothetical protein TVAG_116900 [Trichomonas vaginalis G3]KAI5491083.1 hypothetical protein TVAGG3_1005170 [Trichomonas vaginalis G3]|eukprot:XP_001310102.1 hypothetical protein [Trichomonas vaginalis G3]
MEVGETKHQEIPYSYNKIRIHQTPAHVSNLQGVSSIFEKYRWQTAGSVKPIEQGLPLVSESTLSHDFADAKEIDEKIKLFDEKITEDLLNPENNIDLPKESKREYNTEDETQGHQSSFKKLYLSINQKRLARQNRPQTGISKQVDYNGNLIDCMGKLTLRSVQGKENLEAGENPFPVIPRRQETVGIPKRAESQIVKVNMKKVFRPNSRPFTEIDNEEDFPMSVFKLGKIKTVFSRNTLELMKKEEEEKKQSLLVDLSNEDVFWTKDRVPFTRSEVEMMKKFREDCKTKTSLANRKRSQVMKERQDAISRTFQSRKAFEKEVEITEKVCRRTMTLPPGKGEEHYLSWTMAAKEAKTDPSSLPYRKNAWQKLGHLIKEIGGLKEGNSKLLIMTFRRLLLSGEPISKETLFDTLEILDRSEFADTDTAMTIEAMREACGVSTDELLNWMKSRNCPTEIMVEIPDHIKRQNRMKALKEKKQSEKDRLERVKKCDFVIPDVIRGFAGLNEAEEL